MAAGSGMLRRALVRHAVISLVVVLVAVVAIAAGIAWFARQDAYRTAEHTARQIGASVGDAVSRHDVSVLVDPATRADLDTALAPFIESGIVSRVKIWEPRNGEARIVYSDEPRIEGEVVRYDAATLDELGAGGTVVQQVPDDTEHRFEFARSGTLLEVFTTFRDRSGTESWLELYIRVDEMAALRATVLPVVAAAAAGLVLLALLTLPITISLVRRAERQRIEHRAARDYGLAAGETARREIAQRLHEGVLPDLASVGLLLEVARNGETDAGEVSMVGRAHALLADEMRQLRGLLDELVRPSVASGGLAGALAELADRIETSGSAAVAVRTSLDHPLPGDLELAIHRVAHELVRNALRHAEASRVDVTVEGWADGVVLTVSDDGRGFDVTAPAGEGHVGLLLVRGVIEDRGGELEIGSASTDGTTVRARFPVDGRAPVAPPGASVGAGVDRGRGAWRRLSGAVRR